MITLHRVTNYGSVLQTFAIQRKLTILGFECETIDYIPLRLTALKWYMPRVKNDYFLKNLLRNLYLLTWKFRVRLLFYKFLDSYINLSQYKYYSLKDFDKKPPKSDVFLTGSDQVWNCFYNDGIDRPYYLSFANNSSRKISYAASFGIETIHEIDIKQREEIKYLLSDYEKISVREVAALGILDELNIKGGQIVLDPTFLLSKEEWIESFGKKDIKSDYVLVYNLNTNKKLNDFAINYAKHNGLRTVIINVEVKKNLNFDKNYMFPTPIKFLELFYNANFVVTDSFHGTAFALIFNKQFACISPPRFSNRIISILNLTGLSDRLISEDCVDYVFNKIDYKLVNKIIKLKKKQSLEYLINALSDKGE